MTFLQRIQAGRLNSPAVSNATLDAIPYMIWTYDRFGALNYVNTAWISYTGLNLAETVAQPTLWPPLLAADGHESFAELLKNAMVNGKSFCNEAKLRDRFATGDGRWHTINVQPISDADGGIRSWIGTAVDIEDHKRALLESKKEHQRERTRSTLFQEAALPANLPEVSGLSFDAIYEPGLSDAQVGGDWYDAIRLLDGRVLLTIGDVAGSGLEAAVVMGVVRQIMRGIAQLHAEPALMLDAADRAMRLEYPDTLVTAWVGILDLVGHTLTYASAGHPAPLLIDMRGGVHDLDHLTLPIGLRQGHQGHASTITISNGSVIWLYTDGLIEASHNIVDGSRRLHETASRVGADMTAGAATMIRTLMIPNGSPDDVAILVVKIDFDESERYITRSHFDSGDAGAASNARRAFAAALSTKRFTDVDIANAEIVFGELCGNVARYAKGRVDVVVDSSGIQTVLHVLDRGVGFQHVSRLPRDLFSEKGRGLFIIAAMTTEFTVSQRLGGGSHARAVLVGRRPISLLREETLPVVTDQVAQIF